MSLIIFSISIKFSLLCFKDFKQLSYYIKIIYNVNYLSCEFIISKTFL
nr:MAG TPA: hypothetical protein [Caudoviricetes sp.]